MPRRPRHATADFAFHVLNRAVEGLVLFEERADFESFLAVLRDAVDLFHVLLFAYAIMHNHWHLVLRTPEGNLSQFMHWLTGTHVRRWRNSRNSSGRGAVYQSRFTAVAVEEDAHFLSLCRYVERNPLKPRLVARAEDWEWSSASPSAVDAHRPALAPWPIPKPSDWKEMINVPDSTPALAEVRAAVRTGLPFGATEWQQAAVKALDWRVRMRGRPRTRC